MSDDNSDASSPTNDRPIRRKLSYYAVLYLDLMGQHEAIAELEKLQLLRDNQSAYYRRFGEAAGKVWGVRFFLVSRMNKGLAMTLASAAYPVPRVTVQMFADTVMVYFPWNRDNPNAFVALYSLLVATAETMICALAGEIPIRGGLDVHVATEFNEQTPAENSSGDVFHGGDIWGPAPKRAYDLAEKDHNYMRVRVGKGVSDLVIESVKHISEELKTDPSKVPWFEPAVDPAKHTVKLFAKDPVDKSPILDYFGLGMADVLAPETKALIGEAVAFAESTCKRMRIAPDRGIADKYEKLVTYITARREPNGIVPALATR